MRHKKKVKKLGRPKEHRKALLRNQAISLIQYGRIKTTLPKAKAVRSFTEKLITLAKNDSQSSRRYVFSLLANKNASEKLFKEIAPKFKNRNSGFIRIIKLGPRRGDGAEEVVLEFV